MSKPTIVCGLLFGAIAGFACATGGQAGDGDRQDAATSGGQKDASTSITPDAPRPHPDAGMTGGQDAQVSQLPDAGGGSGSGVFCSTNSQCTNSGECCVTLGGPQGFCAPGTVVLGQCVPQ